MATIHFEATVTINDEEVEVSVEAEYTPGFRGTMYARNGDPGDPPESAEVEITSIEGPDGIGSIDYDDLLPADQARLDDKALEKGADRQYDSHADYDD